MSLQEHTPLQEKGASEAVLAELWTKVVDHREQHRIATIKFHEAEQKTIHTIEALQKRIANTSPAPSDPSPPNTPSGTPPLLAQEYCLPKHLLLSVFNHQHLVIASTETICILFVASYIDPTEELIQTRSYGEDVIIPKQKAKAKKSHRTSCHKIIRSLSTTRSAHLLHRSLQLIRKLINQLDPLRLLFMRRNYWYWSHLGVAMWLRGKITEEMRQRMRAKNKKGIEEQGFVQQSRTLEKQIGGGRRSWDSSELNVVWARWRPSEQF